MSSPGPPARLIQRTLPSLASRATNGVQSARARDRDGRAVPALGQCPVEPAAHDRFAVAERCRVGDDHAPVTGAEHVDPDQALIAAIPRDEPRPRRAVADRIGRERHAARERPGHDRAAVVHRDDRFHGGRAGGRRRRLRSDRDRPVEDAGRRARLLARVAPVPPARLARVHPARVRSELRRVGQRAPAAAQQADADADAASGYEPGGAGTHGARIQSSRRGQRGW